MFERLLTLVCDIDVTLKTEPGSIFIAGLSKASRHYNGRAVSYECQHFDTGLMVRNRYLTIFLDPYFFLPPSTNHLDMER